MYDSGPFSIIPYIKLTLANAEYKTEDLINIDGKDMTATFWIKFDQLIPNSYVRF
jgi:hypothetical protein